MEITKGADDISPGQYILSFLLLSNSEFLYLQSSKKLNIYHSTLMTLGQRAIFDMCVFISNKTMYNNL